MYLITCQISSSVMPTPCCVAPFGGMAVPGTPSLIVRNKSASEFPWCFCARLRSGPRPPPRAPNPWQNAQFARNCDSPSFAACGSPANGFLSWACTRIAGVPHASSMTHPHRTDKFHHRDQNSSRRRLDLAVDMGSLCPLGLVMLERAVMALHWNEAGFAANISFVADSWVNFTELS